MKLCDENLKKTLELVNAMIDLANKGEIDREDTGCGVLYGILLDSAYKIKMVGEQEREAHIKKGWWQDT